MKPVFKAWFVISVLFGIVTLPGLVVVILRHSPQEEDQVEAAGDGGNASATCYESREIYGPVNESLDFWISVVAVNVIGIAGMIGNLVTMFVLRRMAKSRIVPNFNGLLTCLVTVDLVFITEVLLENAVYTWRDSVKNRALPTWFIHAFPFFIYPVGNLLQTLAMTMVVAVAAERYRAFKNPFGMQLNYKVVRSKLAVKYNV